MGLRASQIEEEVKGPGPANSFVCLWARRERKGMK